MNADEKPLRDEKPMDRLTRMCDAMIDAFTAHPEYQEGDKCVVFLDNDQERMGGPVLNGYDDDHEAIVNVFMHLRAIFRANGQDMEIIGVPNSPEGLEAE
jgi:hypothetical protein